jgi:hypothetical protein
MAISDVIEKLGRALFEAPFGTNRVAKDAPELAEIRLAVLDAVKAKSHRANGKHVFPYNLIRIQLLGVPREQQAVFTSHFLTSYFTRELKDGLLRSNYRFPEDLEAEIHTTPDLPMPGAEWLTVETQLISSTEDPIVAQEVKLAKLTVIHGLANRPEILLRKARTNIGRTVEVYRGAGPSRRNDLAFTEDNETNKTVSREHAHILYSRKDGTYRLFNDRLYKGEANCGLLIVRDGLSLPVHRSDRGTVLESRDEIHMGNAVLRFQLK